MGDEIRPRNLTARAAHQVVGNPISTRFESGVANCFPGLEWDVRELDRRFFPGLVFQYVTTPLRPQPGIRPNQQGARLVYVDSAYDPMLPIDSDEPWIKKLLATLQIGIVPTNPLDSGRFYLDWFEQHGKRYQMHDHDGTPWDGELVWRMVRAIEPDAPLALGLRARDDDGRPTGDEVRLDGYRRRFVDAAGVIDRSFKAGELTMAMCNPWSHDFRDCACHYWASNHPDVVLGPDEETLPDQEPASAEAAAVRLDWLRSDRGPAGRTAATATNEQNRPTQLDHYELNARWQDLPFVVEGREIGPVYRPAADPDAEPYADTTELVNALGGELAPLELTLALSYLYARWSVRPSAEIAEAEWPGLGADVEAVRQQLLLVAVGEMTHLRWVNQLLWSLDAAGLYPPGRRYEPVLTTLVERGVDPGAHELLPLTHDRVMRFEAIERPGGTIDTAYARAVATLRSAAYPPHLLELASRIDADGNVHYQRFRDVARVLGQYPSGTDAPYLRPVRPGTREEAAAALRLYDQLLGALRKAYAEEARGRATSAQAAIGHARDAMVTLDGVADALAARHIGIPFWAPPG